MNVTKFLFFLLVVALTTAANVFAQETTKNSIAILPISSAGIDSIYVQTAESILRVETRKQTKSSIVSERKTKLVSGSANCTDLDCAVRVGKELDVDLVVSCKLSALGDKILALYLVADVKTGKEIMSDQVTATKVEDLEMVMKRIAKSIAEHASVQDGAEVGNIMAVEAEKPLRRSSNKNFGISFGYLYPTSGYDNSTEKSFVLDLRWGYEVLNDYAVGLLMGVRNGFAINLYGDYLLTRTDVCPYFGGSFGFHWVSHNEPQAVYVTDPNTGYMTYTTQNQDLRSDGLEMGAHAGLRLFRTFSFQIILQVDIIHTFNDYDDNAVVFTIGML